jgi:arsenate reductase
MRFSGSRVPGACRLKSPIFPNPMSLEIELLSTAHCTHVAETRDRIRVVLERLCPEAALTERTVTSLQEAERLAFTGSPTVRVNGLDVDGDGGSPTLACREYGAASSPPEWMIEAAVLGAAAPPHVLFLCVANSARSQMAEAIARRAAPPGTRVSSAGSVPTRVRPEALEVLAELGIDASTQRSKGTDEVEGDVDVVVTLCAEEVCPVWLRPAKRVHWGLPDPAAVEGPEEVRLDAFRAVRDELVRRLGVLFRSAV